MKKYLIFAASALALASCSSDDFLGENPGNVQNATTAINFGGEAGKITRANTSNTAPTDAGKLAGQFKVYGVKKTNDGMFRDVFPNYYVWDDANSTTSNTNGWEYVGEKGKTGLGTGSITLPSIHDQTIKYWDYSASEYRFVAGSPIDAFTYNKDLDNISTMGTVITSATVTGLAGHIKANEAGTALETYPVYVAEPVIVKKTEYPNTVKFEFVRQQAMVRVGLYETIPGYSITEINFYEKNATTATSNNVILTSATENYFVGGSNVKGTVTYDWTAAKPSYTYEYTDDTNLTKSKNWYAGKFTPDTKLATTSSETAVATLYGTDKDMSETGYFTVLPTPTATDASPILIKCDYTLKDFNTGEVIKVTGATAAIPAAFSKWEANTRYTYLFKISDNTNGTTGTTGDRAGLFPITFAAAVKESTDAQYGTTTTVTTPSITTYQEGSVVDKTIEYKTGKPIYATVADETTGTLNGLTTGGTDVGNVQVYKLSKERTEAELQVKAIFDTEITTTRKFDTSVPASDLTVGIGKLDANKYLTFTPDTDGWYAIQYKYADGAYKYKVIEVK